MLNYQDFLILSAVLFSIGLLGVLIRRNAIVVFMCLELMMNSANMAIVAFATKHSNVDGLILAFFVLVLAAAEAVIGLSIFIRMHRLEKTLSLEMFCELKD